MALHVAETGGAKSAIQTHEGRRAFRLRERVRYQMAETGTGSVSLLANSTRSAELGGFARNNHQNH